MQWSRLQGQEVLPWQSAVAGSASGAVAAAVTTPLDVAKTHIMLAKVLCVFIYFNVNIINLFMHSL